MTPMFNKYLELARWYVVRCVVRCVFMNEYLEEMCSNEIGLNLLDLVPNIIGGTYVTT